MSGMNEPGVGVLLDQETLAERVAAGSMPAWVGTHWRSFRTSMLGERDGAPFPCYFGVEAVAAGDPLYTACRSTTDRDALLALRDTLVEYLRVFEDVGPFERSIVPVFDRVSLAAGDRVGTAGADEKLLAVDEEDALAARDVAGLLVGVAVLRDERPRIDPERLNAHFGSSYELDEVNARGRLDGLSILARDAFHTYVRGRDGGS